MKTLLIRADDLGYSEGVNYGIAKCVKEGVIKSVGLMTNMPAAKHGLELLQGENVCFGQHTNICVGRPLTDPVLIPSITQKNGEFRPSQVYRSAEEDFVVLEEVVIEIEAQLKKFVELTGELPHYFEGHAVASANFFRGLELVAEKYGLKYSGMPLDGQPMLIGHTTVYVSMDGMKPDYVPFSALKSTVEHSHEDGCDMLVCHPGYLDGYILNHSSLTTPRPLEVDMLCDPATRNFLEDSNVRLVTYDDL